MITGPKFVSSWKPAAIEKIIFEYLTRVVKCDMVLATRPVN